MLRFSGLLRTGAVLGLALAGVAPATGATSGAPAPGPVGPRTLLQDTTQLYGYDVATDSAGNGYVAWISDDSATAAATRKVRLCFLPPLSSACSGGVQTIDALGPSSAAGLKVLTAPAGALIVWFHDTSPGSVTGPRGGRIAAAQVNGGILGAATEVTDAPSFGQLLDAGIAPDGGVWTVAYQGVGTTSLEVRATSGPVVETVSAPYAVGKAELAFAGSTPVLAVTQYGSVSTPISTAHRTGGTWSGFSSVRNTWSVGTVGLAGAGGSVHVVAATGNASYVPVVAHFTGSGFTVPTRTGDTSSCAPSSHDLVSDASGRLADVSNECGRITVANQPLRGRAALVRFAAGSTVADGDPQIGTTPRGYGWVAWSTQTTVGNKLQVTRVRLPALGTSRSRRSAAARLTVSGPASCLPPVGARVGVSARGRNGWRVTRTTLRLDGAGYSRGTVDGSTLSPGSRHVLTGRAVLTRSGSTVARTATLAFRSCPSP
jgi:hypothetical protein